MSAASPVRVAVVNDYEIVVAGIAAVLQPYADRVSVVEIAAGRAVVSDVDVLLYDTFGQSQGGSVPVRSLLSSGTRLVVFSWNRDPDVVAASLAAGASAYLPKSVTGQALVEAIEQVHAGQHVVSAHPVGGARLGRWPGDDRGLSPRESEVLALICQGFSNEEITERAFIGINTVKTHIRTLYRKIGVASRTQAVIWGHANGFDPDRVRHVTS